MISDDIIRIPRAALIDYSNAEEVEGYSLYLVKLYEREGGFKLPRSVTPLMMAIEFELQVWCDKVIDLLSDDAPLPAVALLIKALDLPHRVAYRKAPERKSMRKIRINAAQRWAKGEKTVSPAVIANVLRDEIYSREFSTLENKYGLFYFGLIGDWVKELRRNGEFAGVTKAETYTRLKLIMGEDLFGEYGSKGAEKDKRLWAENHIVGNLSTLDTPTLRAYIEFMMAYSEMRAVPMDGYAEYVTLFTELNSRQDINSYLHSALTIDLALKGDGIKEVG